MYFEYFFKPMFIAFADVKISLSTSYMQHQGATTIFGDTQNNSSTHIAQFCAQSQ